MLAATTTRAGQRLDRWQHETHGEAAERRAPARRYRAPRHGRRGELLPGTALDQCEVPDREGGKRPAAEQLMRASRDRVLDQQDRRGGQRRTRRSPRGARSPAPAAEAKSAGRRSSAAAMTMPVQESGGHGPPGLRVGRLRRRRSFRGSAKDGPTSPRRRSRLAASSPSDPTERRNYARPPRTVGNIGTYGQVRMAYRGMRPRRKSPPRNPFGRGTRPRGQDRRLARTTVDGGHNHLDPPLPRPLTPTAAVRRRRPHAGRRACGNSDDDEPNRAAPRRRRAARTPAARTARRWTSPGCPA